MSARALLFLVLVGDADPRVPYLGVDGAVGVRHCLDLEAVKEGGPAARGGLKAGDCITRARLQSAEWGEYCTTLKAAHAGDALDVELADGGVRSIVLGSCAKASFDVNVQLEGTPIDVDVPRSTTIGELRKRLGVKGACTLHSSSACSEPAASVADVSDSFTFNTYCHRVFRLRCASQPLDDRQPANLHMPSGATLTVQLRSGEQPPGELRCLSRKLEPRAYECAGKPAPGPVSPKRK